MEIFEMGSVFSNRYTNPLGVGNRGMGGAARNLGIEALAGETDLVCVFDDFNHVIATTDPALVTDDDSTNIWEDCGWVCTVDNTPTAATVWMNDAAVVTNTFDSCIHFNPGTKADSGFNMQLDAVNPTLAASTANTFTSLTGQTPFNHIWIAETGAGVTALDNSVFIFACRLGFASSAAAGWDGKAFVGWAAAGDTSILTHDTGVITITSGGPLVGFHIDETGSIDGISHRTAATAMAEGTNFTELAAATAADNASANVYTWWDLALRMEIGDVSETVNGSTRFYSRRVGALSGRVGSRERSELGVGEDWAEHGTILMNQIPNHTVALVPTIEILNGPTNDVDMKMDWWVMGCSRYSR
jgi:hypothetical protein